MKCSTMTLILLFGLTILAGLACPADDDDDSAEHDDGDHAHGDDDDNVFDDDDSAGT